MCGYLYGQDYAILYKATWLRPVVTDHPRYCKSDGAPEEKKLREKQKKIIYKMIGFLGLLIAIYIGQSNCVIMVNTALINARILCLVRRVLNYI